MPIKQSFSVSLHFQPLAVTNLLFYFCDDISHKWNDTLLTFCVWLLSLSVMFLRLSHTVAYISTSLLFMAG